MLITCPGSDERFFIFAGSPNFLIVHSGLFLLLVWTQSAMPLSVLYCMTNATSTVMRDLQMLPLWLKINWLTFTLVCVCEEGSFWPLRSYIHRDDIHSKSWHFNGGNQVTDKHVGSWKSRNIAVTPSASSFCFCFFRIPLPWIPVIFHKKTGFKPVTFNISLTKFAWFPPLNCHKVKWCSIGVSSLRV